MKTFSILFGLLATTALLASILDPTARHQLILSILSAFMSIVTWKYGKIQKIKK